MKNMTMLQFVALLSQSAKSLGINLVDDNGSVVAHSAPKAGKAKVAVAKVASVTPKVAGKAKVSAGKTPAMALGTIFTKETSVRPYVSNGSYGVRVGFDTEGVAKCNDKVVLGYLGSHPEKLQKVYDLYISRCN